MSYAQVTSKGQVVLVTPTGKVPLTRDDGHQLIFHGAPVCVNGISLERYQRTIFFVVGGTSYTLNACSLGRLFKGEATRCRIYPVEINALGGVRHDR